MTRRIRSSDPRILTRKCCDRFRSVGAYWVLSQLALCSPNRALSHAFEIAQVFGHRVGVRADVALGIVVRSDRSVSHRFWSRSPRAAAVLAPWRHREPCALTLVGYRPRPCTEDSGSAGRSESVSAICLGKRCSVCRGTLRSAPNRFYRYLATMPRTLAAGLARRPPRPPHRSRPAIHQLIAHLARFRRLSFVSCA